MSNTENPYASENAKKFSRIFDYFGVQINTICEATGIEEDIVKDVIVSGHFNNITDTAKTRKLGLILQCLSGDMIDIYTTDEIGKHMLVVILCQDLRQHSHITNEIISKYAKIEVDTLNAYLSGQGDIPAELEFNLLATLFTLNNLLNQKGAFPWNLCFS